MQREPPPMNKYFFNVFTLRNCLFKHDSFHVINNPKNRFQSR